ncbi:unnamed protein product [Dibothriocephalus latus]|uniref:Major facilitator superfamily (MFS) profile domain-containing protein n=1 Tax=Dibothriocephalus latus TaxID=60516 RepID=A0A3P6TY25_DIBLA|nr:unnamed protein product [Dibothriocephalus latus]
MIRRRENIANASKIHLLAGNVHTKGHDWGLVCSQTYMLRISQVMHMTGLFIGAPTCGKLADMYGRLKILYISLVLLSILSFAVAFAPGIYAFCGLTFLQGIACQGCGLTSYTVILESVGAKYRALGGILEQHQEPEAAWCFVNVFIALIEYICFERLEVPHDSAETSENYSPKAIFTNRTLLDKSPRWLLTKPDRRQHAFANLAYMARVNGRLDGLNSPETVARLSSPLHSEPSAEVNCDRSGRSSISQGSEPASEDSVSIPLVGTASDAVPLHVANEDTLTLLKHPLLRRWTLIFCLCW